MQILQDQESENFVSRRMHIIYFCLKEVYNIENCLYKLDIYFAHIHNHYPSRYIFEEKKEKKNEETSAIIDRVYLMKQCHCLTSNTWEFMNVVTVELSALVHTYKLMIQMIQCCDLWLWHLTW